MALEQEVTTMTKDMHARFFSFLLSLLLIFLSLYFVILFLPKHQGKLIFLMKIVNGREGQIFLWFCEEKCVHVLGFLCGPINPIVLIRHHKWYKGHDPLEASFGRFRSQWFNTFFPSNCFTNRFSEHYSPMLCSHIFVIRGNPWVNPMLCSHLFVIMGNLCLYLHKIEL